MDEDMSPTFPPSRISSTPENSSTPYGSPCNYMHTQGVEVATSNCPARRQTDQLQDSPAAERQVTNASTKQRNLPRDTVVSITAINTYPCDVDPLPKAGQRNLSTFD